MSTASEDPSIWQSQALKLKHPKTGLALSDLPYRSEAHRDNPARSRLSLQFLTSTCAQR